VRFTASKFIDVLCADDCPAKDEGVDRISRRRRWRPVLSAIATAAPTRPELQDAFHTLWTERGHRIREQIQDDAFLVSVLRLSLPQYGGGPVTLYRGESFSRWSSGVLGFAWSDKIATAGMFARGLNAAHDGGGVLLRVDASPEAIIASPGRHSLWLNEHEYVVDPKLLPSVEVLTRYPQV
jgi:hypothetical protein